jgi:hypothetical protein
MSSRAAFYDEEAITKLIKTAVGGAHDTIAMTNNTIAGHSQVIVTQQQLLMAVNAEIARLSAENAELRRASLERDRVMAMVEVERERMQLSDKRMLEMLRLAKDLGINIITHAMTPPPAPAELPSANGGSEAETLKDIAHRLVRSLSKETITAIRAEAGDETVAALLRAIAQ